MAVSINSSFARPLLSDYSRVAEDVVGVVRALIPGVPPHGEREIHCEHIEGKDEVPHVVWPEAIATQYRINLANIAERDYCMFAYQLAHEMGHVMMDPSRDNGAIEILAVAVSLESLRQLSKKWETNPPYPNWRDFGNVFENHRLTCISDELASLPAGIQKAVTDGDWPEVQKYLLSQRSVLDHEPCHRPLNMLGAVYLSEKVIPWPELRGIASKTVSSADRTTTFDANAPFDPTKVPAWLAPIWQP